MPLDLVPQMIKCSGRFENDILLRSPSLFRTTLLDRGWQPFGRASQARRDHQFASLERTCGVFIQIEFKCTCSDCPGVVECEDLVWTLEHTYRSSPPGVVLHEALPRKALAAGTFLTMPENAWNPFRVPPFRQQSILREEGIHRHGQFYAVWQTPTLTYLAVTTFVLYPDFARAVTALTLWSSVRTKEGHFGDRASRSYSRR